MKIIKDGDQSKVDDILRFECNKCGCIFEADATEYRPYITFGPIVAGVSCKCPTCKREVIRNAAY